MCVSFIKTEIKMPTFSVYLKMHLKTAKKECIVCLNFVILSGKILIICTSNYNWHKSIAIL